jgi:hypothetical protein
MSVCSAVSISVNDQAIVFFGTEGACWRVPVSQLRAIGEVRSATLEDGHYLVVLIDDSGAWFQAPVRAAGMELALERLAAMLGKPLALSLAHAREEASRVLWPEELAEQPLFERDGDPIVVRRAVIEAIAECTRS